MIFLGTPAFAVPSLEALARLRDQKKIDLMAVVTQPDRPGHRGRVAAPPVKEKALRLGLQVIQPDPVPGNGPRWSTAAMWEAVRHLHPDALVWAAYGGIVPKSLIEAVKGRAVNVHPSALPRWRGADPVAHAILAGDEMTGVTLMEATADLDAGPIITQTFVDVPANATTGELEAELAQHGARLLATYLPQYLAGRIGTHPQSGPVTWAPKLDPKQGALDFSRPAEELARIVRAFAPDPGAYTYLQGKRINVLRATAIAGPPAPIGTLVKEAAAKAAAGWLRLDEVKPAGKRAMSGADWARGLRDLAGARLPS